MAFSTLTYPRVSRQSTSHRTTTRLCATRATAAGDDLPVARHWRVPEPERVVLRGVSHDGELLAATHAYTGDLDGSISVLRRHKLALLLDDVACHLRSVGLRDVALESNRLGAKLLALSEDSHDGDARADARKLLWRAREALAPLQPPLRTRGAVERARCALLDVAQKTPKTAQRAEVYALLVENTMLEELRSLRVLERAVRAAIRSTGRHPNQRLKNALHALRLAVAALGIDDYRVRGKARLASAVREVTRSTSGSMFESVLQTPCARLLNATVQSLETDLKARAPLGTAMLLRPSTCDIPNFEVVNDHMLRGGQPSHRGVQWLTHYGVSDFVDLRGSDRANQWIRDVPSVKVHELDIEDFGTPHVEQVLQFCRLINDVARQRRVAFVHCKAGIGRTGVMISCWRILNGAAPDHALSMERLYGPDGGGLKQEQFVRDFALYCAQNKAL